MLHGAEVWFNLCKKEFEMLEQTQNSVLKAIQNLSMRTHSTIVRILIGQSSIQFYIDLNR